MNKHYSMAITPHIQDILDTEGIICLIGQGRSGKTALSHYLLTYAEKPVYAFEYTDEAIALCPPNWNNVDRSTLFQLKDCIILIDDAAIALNSRNFNSSFSKAWSTFQTIISHKSITIVFVIQNTSLLDIATLRSQRIVMLFKVSNNNNIRFERPEYQQTSQHAKLLIEKAIQAHPDEHPKSWYYDDETASVNQHPLAAHWDPGLSVPFRHYVVTYDE
jgi:GTPase SAR1 family protein